MIGLWDVMLIVAVTAQAAMLAYIFDPRWKAFVLLIPIPFTIAVLAMGRPIDAANVWGLASVSLYAWSAVAALPSARADHSGDCGIGTGVLCRGCGHGEGSADW